MTLMSIRKVTVVSRIIGTLALILYPVFLLHRVARTNQTALLPSLILYAKSAQYAK